jgi:hypothetical protein
MIQIEPLPVLLFDRATLYICCAHLIYCRNRRGRDRMAVGFIITYPISAHHMISNPVHDEVYSIQHYVIKSVSDLRQVGGFCPGTPVSFTNKTDRRDINEILLKVALNTINLNPASLLFTNKL